MIKKKRIAIVGFGCAGYHAVKAMREQGYEGQIDVYTDTSWAPGNPMLTTYYIYGKLSRSGTMPFGGMDGLAEKYQFNICREKVERVLSVSKEVLLEGDKKELYDKILITTGASAFVPPIPGIHQENVFVMRTIQDADQLKPVLDAGKIKSAAVIGASMVGIKLIELLTARGIHCTLVDMAPYIFPVSAVPSVADEIQNRLIKKGVDMAFSKALTQIEGKDGKLQVVFKEGEPLTCDAVMMCIGTRANTQVADADLKVNRGIVVDMGMRTNMPDIYSAGDCCEGRNIQSGVNQIIGIWDNAARQGETAGINMAGGNIEYEGNILHNITHFMGMDFIGFGDVRAEGEEHTFKDEKNDRMFVVRMKDHIPVCMNLLDSYEASGVLKSFVFRRMEGRPAVLGPAELVRLKKEGVPQEFIDVLLKG